MSKLDDIHSFETDVVEQTATLYCTPGFDWTAALDKLAQESDKLKDWSVKH